jgi:carbon-monoxide dehydrogenase large subunit
VRPYRGNGRPEAAYVIERMIDLAADELGIDPAELRRRNYIPPDAMPFKSGLTFTYDSGEFEKSMDMALALADFAGFERRRAEARKRGKLRGIGLSNTIERAAAQGFEGAEIRFDKSGAATLLAGSVTHGQGHETIFKQIMCDRLGLDPDEVHYIQGDTDQVFVGEGTGGSRSATIGGSAVAAATERIITKGKAIAAHLLEAAAADIEYVPGLYRIVGTDRAVSFDDMVRAAFDPARLPAGVTLGLDESARYEREAFNYPNGCHVCEVELEPATGAVRVVRYSVVDDFGRIINPLLVRGQVVGGVVQGIGQALMEQAVYDPESAQLLTASQMDYCLPRADNLPGIDVELYEDAPTKTNPLGVKGCGEAGATGSPPAVVNAVVDALRPFGITHLDMPLTAQKVWSAIRSAPDALEAAE